MYSDSMTDSLIFRAAPGLGIQLNKEKIVEAARIGHNWKNPVWRNYDGTMAEW